MADFGEAPFGGGSFPAEHEPQPRQPLGVGVARRPKDAVLQVAHHQGRIVVGDDDGGARGRHRIVLTHRGRALRDGFDGVAPGETRQHRRGRQHEVGESVRDGALQRVPVVGLHDDAHLGEGRAEDPGRLAPAGARDRGAARRVDREARVGGDAGVRGLGRRPGQGVRRRRGGRGRRQGGGVRRVVRRSCGVRAREGERQGGEKSTEESAEARRRRRASAGGSRENRLSVGRKTGCAHG